MMGGTPEAPSDLARAFVEAFAAHPPGALIRNAETTMTLYDWTGVPVPLTVNDRERNVTFVCSPRVAWTGFVRDELALFPNQWLVPPIRGLVRAIEGLTWFSELDRIVHVNNWMMSTNLPSGIDPSTAARQTSDLVERYPGHILAMRSLTRRHAGSLMSALEDAGWIFLPARQVFLVDDMQDALKRRDARNDERLWQTTAFRYEELAEVSEEDAARIVTLYQMLYRQKYSQLNPDYTPGFVQLAHRLRLLRFLVLRDASDVIQAVGGLHMLNGHAAMPLLGYNTALPQSEGLYRLACHAGSRFAAHHGLCFNMSSGVGAFKQNRGATAEIEFTAFYVQHLPRRRRIPFGPLEFIGQGIGIPLLQRYNL
ncbi:MAG: hypothetical protein AAFR73_09200 [Pseudomonadota bacterium]